MQRRMPVPAGGDQHPMPRHGKIISDKPAPDGRYRSTSFVHQKISRCKVPVVAVDTGNSNIVGALGDAGEAKRERVHAWHGSEGRGHRRESFKEAFRTGDAGVDERSAAGGGNRSAVARGARTRSRREEFLGDRSVETSRDWPAVLDKRGGNSPIRLGRPDRRACHRSDRRSRHNARRAARDRRHFPPTASQSVGPRRSVVHAAVGRPQYRHR